MFISPLKLQGLKDRFKREADVMFVEAKRSVVATTAKIPPWFIGLTILLGWNEFVAIMFNPVYFLMIILLVVGK